MSLHSSNAKVGTTEILSRPVGHTTFQTAAPTTVKTVTTSEVKHGEGVSAGEIPGMTIYTDPSTEIRGGHVITTEPSVIKSQHVTTTPVTVTTSKVITGGVPVSQVYGGEFASSQVYRGGVAGSQQVYTGGITPYQVFGGEVPIAAELKEYGHGNLVFRPIEGRFYKNDGYGEMIDPYCKIKVGHHSQKGSMSKTGGVDVAWNDLIKFERKHKDHFAKVKCKDKNKVNMHGNLGYCKVDLNEVAEKGKICGWFPLYRSAGDDKIIGELLLEVQDLNVAGPTVV